MNLFRLIGPALKALQAGQSLKNAAAWKNAAIIGNMLGAAWAALEVCGVHLPITDSTITTVAAAIAAIANAYLTTATSEKVGLPSIELVARSEPDSVQQSGQPEMPSQSDAKPNGDSGESVGFGDK